MLPKDLQQHAAKKRLLAEGRWRRVRRQVATECCLRPCTVADIIMYCPDDAKLLQENPEIFEWTPTEAKKYSVRDCTKELSNSEFRITLLLKFTRLITELRKFVRPNNFTLKVREAKSRYYQYQFLFLNSCKQKKTYKKLY